MSTRKTITIGLAPGDGSATRPYGTIPNDLHALEPTEGR